MAKFIESEIVVKRKKRHVGTPRGKGKSVGVLLTQERLRELLIYNPANGQITWAEGRGYGMAGKQAGRLHPTGYIYVTVDGYRARAHRIAWLWMTGEQPPAIIDHKDGNRQNNAWNNLREADNAQNGWNSKNFSTNTTGHKGVSFHKATGKYQVRIKVRGKQKHIGIYETVEAAAEAYRLASLEMHGEYSFFSEVVPPAGAAPASST